MTALIFSFAPVLAIALADGETARTVEFDTLTVADALKLHGKPVVVALTVWTPAMLTDKEPVRTYLGPADRADGVERVVMLAGKRLDVEQGRRLVVAGTFTVIRHGAALIDGVAVPGVDRERGERVTAKRTGRVLPRPAASLRSGPVHPSGSLADPNRIPPQKRSETAT